MIEAFLIVAVIMFLLAAWPGWSLPVNLIAIGLCFFALAFLWPLVTAVR